MRMLQTELVVRRVDGTEVMSGKRVAVSVSTLHHFAVDAISIAACRKDQTQRSAGSFEQIE